MTRRCFACGRPLFTLDYTADVRDGQIVYVGPECHKKIIQAGPEGWQPPKGGPRLWLT